MESKYPPEEAYVEEVRGLVILKTKSGAIAVVSKQALCSFIERFNLVLVNSDLCSSTSSKELNKTRGEK